MKTKRLIIIVEGKVQGVFYRKSTEQKAKELGLNGFVKNESNGDVYIEVEGNDEVLHPFISWCNDGPENAKVTALQIAQAPLANFCSFKIEA